MPERRVQFYESLFDSNIVPNVVPAGAELCRIVIDRTPPGWYWIQCGNNQSGGTVAADANNFELRKNGVRLFRTPNLQAGIGSGGGPFFLFLNQGDVLTINAIVAGSANAIYGASIQATCWHEAAANPTESPDAMAMLAKTQERISDTLDRLCKLLEGAAK